MRAVEIIEKKRDGLALDEDEINSLIQGYTRGEVPDYQMSAFAMAVYFQGMSKREISFFTNAMLHSGKVMDLSHLKGFAVDKHSTGGVGDKISIPLAPAVAACGVIVPMIAGRGLGHTGGTLDKLESIPGFKVGLSANAFLKQLEKIGCGIIGQTEEIAPADKKLYALRDVTATISSIPLIASSIMSKKLAEGISGLVLDVKYGSGAFMTDSEKAQELAQEMVDIGAGMGKKTVARLTSMEQPIGVMTGNSLEIVESVDVLCGKGPKDVIELVVEFGAEMLLISEKCADLNKGREQILQVLRDGSALDRFKQIIEFQGGNPNVVEDLSLLGRAKSQIIVKAKRDGFITATKSKLIGTASMVLGGGRKKVTDSIDPTVGIETHVRIGEKIETGQTLFVVHSNGKGENEAIELLEEALVIEDQATQIPGLFGPRITAS